MCWSGSGWRRACARAGDAFDALASGLTDANRRALDALLTNDPEVGRSRFTWLRDCPESPAPSNMVELLDRLDYVRSLGVDADRARRIHPGRLTRLVEEGGIMTAQHTSPILSPPGAPPSWWRRSPT